MNNQHDNITDHSVANEPKRHSAGAELLSMADTIPFDREGLASYLHAHGMRVDTARPIRQFAGGFANRNYLLRIDEQDVVLRRPPDGILPPGAHDMAREHRVLSRLSGALSFIPQSLHFCADSSILGVPFQLIEYRSGIVVRGDDMSPVAGERDVPARLSATLVATLARLHSVDADSVGLGDLGRPEGFISRAINGWSKRGQLVSNSVSLRGLIADISGWLANQTFRDRPASILHCDFKLDNMILNPGSLKPVALIDWDMGTRGDPLFDLATMLSYWVEPGDPEALQSLRQMPTAQPGFWSRRAAAERYATLTGCDLEDIHPMRVLALLKLGVVFLQLHRQWTDGAVKIERYAGFGDLGEALLLIARDTATGSRDAST